jgi:hypothetical protein
MTGFVESEELPLVSGQLRYLDMLRKDPAVRTGIWRCVRIAGELDIDRFTDSVETIVSRYDALRIEILDRPGREPRQRIRGVPPRADLISCQDVLARSEEQFSRYIQHVIVQEQRQRWGVDACHAYPFRFRLFRYSPTVHALVLGLSHLAVDGIGAEILVRDLMRTYADTLAGRTPRGRPRRSFAEYVTQWAAASGKGSRHAAQDDPAGVLLPTRFDVPPPAQGERDTRSRQVSLTLAGTELDALRERASLHRCTEFIWILAAFARTVFRFTRQDQVKISVPVNVRGPDEREVVGTYLLVVPVVLERPRDADGERGFVAEVGSAVLRAMVRYRWSTLEGARFRTDLGVLYTRISGLDVREFQPAVSRDLPRVDYLTRGVSVEACSYPVVLDVRAVFDSAVFSEQSAKDVSETLRRNLTSDSGLHGRQSVG